ncbi:MAG TPA: NAD(+) diphosphatase [Roseiflexaceae bacterium]|nr:NAD(+) diphosphatase [Roseiflexaceae bacterium]
MTNPRFRRLYPPAIAPEGAAHWLLFHGDDLLALVDAVPALLEGTSLAPLDLEAVLEPLLLGTLGDRPVLVGRLSSDVPPPSGLQPLGLRAVLAQADADMVMLAGYAAQLLRWHQISRFCPACATPLEANDGWGKVCPACRYSLYPPVSPATITLIHDGGDGVLLTSKPGWGKRYSLVAGFVEPGESLEQCVAREVLEEVGVEITDIEYVDSQPWPFPQQLMIGFMARYAGGEIAIDTSELVDARWFTRDALPELPPPFSIARQIIEQWRASSS